VKFVGDLGAEDTVLSRSTRTPSPGAAGYFDVVISTVPAALNVDLPAAG